ncbi:hypothetical protein HYW74_02270 [Candidatus Pacearchaeota archaeon]|nr:hypothetical protein [Candidatus Pacearchaeota archaeon]
MLNTTAVHALVESQIRYDLAVERAEEEANLYSIDYLQGYMDSYESGRGFIKRTLEKVFGESPKIIGFRKNLENRSDLN